MFAGAGGVARRVAGSATAALLDARRHRPNPAAEGPNGGGQGCASRWSAWAAWAWAPRSPC
jgi:hypothetical protein